MATLRARNFEGFQPLSSVGIEYINTNDSFSIYVGEHQVCRISIEGVGVDQRVTIEIFSTKLYMENVEAINNVVSLIDSF